jgi:hypothetical protein
MIGLKKRKKKEMSLLFEMTKPPFSKRERYDVLRMYNSITITMKKTNKGKNVKLYKMTISLLFLCTFGEKNRKHVGPTI